jgi:hypothetical protein
MISIAYPMYPNDVVFSRPKCVRPAIYPAPPVYVVVDPLRFNAVAEFVVVVTVAIVVVKFGTLFAGDPATHA